MGREREVRGCRDFAICHVVFMCIRCVWVDLLAATIVPEYRPSFTLVQLEGQPFDECQ